MKKAVIVLVFVFAYTVCFAQNAGRGTAPPDDGGVKWLDAGFLYDVTTDDGGIHLNLFTYNFTAQNQAEVNLVDQLADDLKPGTFQTAPSNASTNQHSKKSARWQKSAGIVKPGPVKPIPKPIPVPVSSGPQNAEQYFALLNQNCGMSIPGRLLLLSTIGDLLSEGYDENPKDINLVPTMDQIFANAQVGGKKGGVCRGIHQFIMDSAKALCFDADPTGIEAVERGRDGHAIAAYRDPVTGEFYIQDYSLIIYTHTKDEIKAADLATRILGPVTQTSFVENNENQGHVYIPRTTRWLKSVIDDSFQFQTGHPLVKLRFGNMENLASFQLSQKLGDHFVVDESTTYTRYDTDQGPFQVALAGVGVKFNDSVDNPFGPLTNATIDAQLKTGFFHISTPMFDPTSTAKSDSQNDIFFNGQVTGTASIDKVTGQIVYQDNQIFTPPGEGQQGNFSDTTLTPGIFYSPLPVFQVGAERQFRYQYRSYQDNGDRQYRTEFDKLDFVVDTRDGKDKKVFIIDKSEIYLFEGIPTVSAVALRNQLMASVDKARWGTFSILSDYSQFLQDRSHDPFYNGLPSELVGGDYVHKLGDRAAFDASFQTLVDSQPYWMFEEVATPSYNFKRRFSLAITW